MLTRDRSTYQSLISSVLDDINDEERLSHIQKNSLRIWINKAQETITQDLIVKDSYKLRLKSNQFDYPFQDRPIITNIDLYNDAGILTVQVTSALHGLSEQDIVNLTDVSGELGELLEGRWLVKIRNANQFLLNKFSYISNVVSGTPHIVITANNHGLTGGDEVTIFGVKGNTAANVTCQIIYIDENTFELDGISGSGDYAGGGIVYKPLTLSSITYGGGGRYWKVNEIPTSLKKIYNGFGSLNGYQTIIKYEDWSSMERSMINSYSLLRQVEVTYEIPQTVSVWHNGGMRYARFWKKPGVDVDVTLYGRYEHKPDRYIRDRDDSMIQLSNDYNQLIEIKLREKLYRWLKEHKLAQEEFMIYKDALRTMKRKYDTPRTEVFK